METKQLSPKKTASEIISLSKTDLNIYFTKDEQLFLSQSARFKAVRVHYLIGQWYISPEFKMVTEGEWYILANTKQEYALFHPKKKILSTIFHGWYEQKDLLVLTHLEKGQMYFNKKSSKFSSWIYVDRLYSMNGEYRIYFDRHSYSILYLETMSISNLRFEKKM